MYYTFPRTCRSRHIYRKKISCEGLYRHYSPETALANEDRHRKNKAKFAVK